MNEINFSVLREKLTSENIKEILLQYDIKSHLETDKYIIYPTVCHNLSGGSNKLYYYKNSHMFRCYTQCNDNFDIFELLIKINKLRGININIFDAIKICGLNIQKQENDYNTEESIEEDITYLYNLLYTKTADIDLPYIDNNILNRFVFDMKALKVWNMEGISYNTMLKYNISYDPINNCIIIPNFDSEGNLIGIRGRFFDDKAKYKPILYNKQILSSPSSATLYGLNFTKAQIKNTKQVIIFEAEKSVMKMDTIYGNKNNSVATLGKNISNQHIKILSKLGVEEVILAYDADYRNFSELENKRKEYLKIANSLKNYFNVCILLDLNMNLLDYKDSPIDKGKEIFEKILLNRLYV